MASNVQAPRFSSASGAKGDWSEIDTLDVDMLADYLLGDGVLNSAGVTFDFNLEGNSKQNSTVVSPENSEDGNMPLLGETQAAPARIPPAPAAAANPAAYTAIAALPQQLPTIPIATTPVVFPTVVVQPPKRRRVEMPAAAAAAPLPVPTAMLNGQQLAAAAAQAMCGQRGKKSQAQIDRRRERNRILARRTRLRKKFFFESLQKEVQELQRENLMLKEMVKLNLGDASDKILSECTAVEKLPASVVEACGGTDSCNEVGAQDFSLVRSIQSSQHSFVITDPSLTDNPIVFASDDFLKLVGYSREQVLGRNCRFLQGTDTSKETLAEIRKGLSVGDDVNTTIVNYMADGTPFWNKLFIAALRDAQNNIVNFIGVIVRVKSPPPGHPEHGKVLKADTEEETTQ